LGQTDDTQRVSTVREDARQAVGRLGPLERRIMEILWAAGEASVREVAERLTDGRGPAYTTVMTVMTRLSEKGLLRRELRGNAYVYAPVKSREEFMADASRRALQTLMEDFGEAALAHLIQEIEQVDPARLERLAAFLREKERDARGDA
jgi:predicted transcriptional regulator